VPNTRCEAAGWSPAWVRRALSCNAPQRPHAIFTGGLTVGRHARPSAWDSEFQAKPEAAVEALRANAAREADHWLRNYTSRGAWAVASGWSAAAGLDPRRAVSPPPNTCRRRALTLGRRGMAPRPCGLQPCRVPLRQRICGRVTEPLHPLANLRMPVPSTACALQGRTRWLPTACPGWKLGASATQSGWATPIG
jgi:hypothetical protein